MNKQIIFKCLTGSRAYGTQIETSDYDYRGVYVQDNDEILTFKYKEQFEVGKDETYYEVRRFLQLAQSANPTILEMLFTHSLDKPTLPWMQIRDCRKKFLTKKCADSFGGYAVAQIKKAKGLDKKMNWEKSRVERKTPLDFCYVYDHEKGGAQPYRQWLKEFYMNDWNVAISGIDHFQNCYRVHIVNIGPSYKGIATEDSNELRVISLDKKYWPLKGVMLYYNKDGYSMHCKDFKEYTEWLEKRNTQRYVDTGHGQQIDGKNLMHCRRLLDMAIEIAETGDLKVMRPNADYLLKIRRGEVSLQQIIDEAEEDIVMLDSTYHSSGLPQEVDMDFLNDLLLQVRKL